VKHACPDIDRLIKTVTRQSFGIISVRKGRYHGILPLSLMSKWKTIKLKAWVNDADGIKKLKSHSFKRVG
jgi:hypothetical protein